jgi:hypothetical protein
MRSVEPVPRYETSRANGRATHASTAPRVVTESQQ